MATDEGDESGLPKAVWSGEICGVRVHVLDNGERIVDADDFTRLLNGEGPEGFDVDEFAAKFSAWKGKVSP